VPKLSVDETVTFLIEFRVSEEAKEGEYDVKIVAISDQATDRKSIKFFVFQSIKELLLDGIKRAREELELLKTKIDVAKKAGKDVSEVMTILEKVLEEIESAEKNLEENKFEDSRKSLTNAETLLFRANVLLEQMLAKREFLLPVWLVVLLVILASGIVFGLTRFFREKKIPKMKPLIWLVKKEVEEKEEKKEEILREREKILSILDLIEKERERGVLTKGAYEELRKSLTADLEKIRRKLKRKG
jgi:hypothetical protein